MITYALAAIGFTAGSVLLLAGMVAGWHWLEERISEHFQK